MKRLTIFPLALLFALSASSRLVAADPPSSFGLAPAAPEPLQSPQPAPAPQSPSSLPLIPDAVPPAGAGGTPAPNSSKVNQTVAQDEVLRKHIQVRKALTKAQRDPGLQAIMAQAYKVPTDFEQRKLFIDYYNGLCNLVAKIDPTIPKDDVEALRRSYTGRYYEARIAPTIDPATFRKK